ncbi:uncharacterized protein LOC122057267 [Macadamia integrifolia]|uniref:uncharacterized protein LOC122057267 n=1 Tax=Macadamia integrifolia TaxID=60698 RepID=UPI001C52F54B|nr:uncharacterized protein LOC122057267 [Macadamia integrifolia]
MHILIPDSGSRVVVVVAAVMNQTSSLLLSNQLTVRPMTSRWFSSSLFRRRAVVSPANVILAAANSGSEKGATPIIYKQCSTTAPISHFATSFGLRRPTPELGLISLVFVLSTAAGAIFLLALISIPTKNAFRKLSASMRKLSKVVSEEVPGTLSSLKLSGIEINDLTQQLSTLRQKISGYQNGKRGRSK